MVLSKYVRLQYSGLFLFCLFFFGGEGGGGKDFRAVELWAWDLTIGYRV